MSNGPAVIYLDVDDEITSAATRIRAAGGRRVAVVIPPGSRIATSRINFRLLAREAFAQGRDLAVIAPDAPSRALAASAGLPVYGSVGELEAASAQSVPAGAGAAVEPAPERAAVAPAPERSAPGSHDEKNGGSAVAGTADEGTIIIPPVAAGSGPPSAASERQRAGAPEPQRTPAPAVAERAVRAPGPRYGRLLPIAAALALLVLVAGGVAAYVVLPSARVVVTPRVERLGPISFVVRADPDAAGVDATNGVIPAERLSFDLSATDTFKASGTRVQQSTATGVVKWTNCDPTASYRIPSGTIVRTRSGIQFATTESVFLPVASLSGSPPDLTVNCQSNDSGVKATAAGPDGNVDANAITVVPAIYDPKLIKVTNPDPTSGGARQTFPVVQRKDVDDAQAALRKELSNQLDAELGKPNAVPEAVTLFPASKQISTPVPDTDPASLVGQEVATFELTLNATGSVVAVDESPLEQIAAQRLASSVRPDRALVDGSVSVTTGKASVGGQVISFPVEASASQRVRIDVATLREQIRGRPVDEARRTLEQYGAVAISTWPGWVGSIPTLDQRLDLTVGTPGPSAGSAPSAAPSAS